MRRQFLDLLVCPECAAQIELDSAAEEDEEGDVVEGQLRCTGCERAFPIRNRIPRFVSGPTYADTFGWQWKKFHQLQRDSYNGTTLVRDTILKRSGWQPENLRGKRVLECGCGSGSDTEVLAGLVGTLVSVDISESVEAMPIELLRRKNILVARADLHKLPFRPGGFDLVYCHRVIQHTPDPEAAFQAMARQVRGEGVFFLHTYDTHWKSLLQYKYWLRPFVRWLPHAVIFRMLCLIGPVLYPVVGVLNRIAFLRRPIRLLLPFENYSRGLKRAGAKLTARERYQYSLLVTFDALTPRHDHPTSVEEVKRWFQSNHFAAVNVRGRNPVVALGVKQPRSSRERSDSLPIQA